MHKPKMIGMVAAMAALLLVGAQAAPAGAAGPVRFGAKLTHDLQPSNAEGGQTCADEIGFPAGSKCTWIEMDAYQRAGHERAPKTGTLKSIRLISCVAGSFRLQIARVKPNQDKAIVVREGPVIHYKADPRQIDGDEDTFCGGDAGDDYKIQTFSANSTHVNAGDWLAMKTGKTGMLRCSGGTNLLAFHPPLNVGDPYRHGEDDDCFILLEAQYK